MKVGKITPYQLAMLAATMDPAGASHHPTDTISNAVELLDVAFHRLEEETKEPSPAKWL